MNYTFNGNAAGSGAQSTTEGPLQVGSYTFAASSTGDGNYIVNASGPEPLTINKGTLTLNTAILDAATGNAPTGALGESVYDTSTLSGAQPFAFTGTVNYTFNGNAAGSGAQSTTEGPLQVGSYTFAASSTGDGNYIVNASGPEPLTINKGTLTLNTAILDAATGNAPTGALGESVYDTSTLSGAQPFAFTGTVNYTFNGNAAGSGAQSTTEGPLQAGSYTFAASSSGDNNYIVNASGPEPLTINKGSSSISTAIKDSSGGAVTGTVGEQVYDTAAVSGTPFTPTGTVMYDFYNTANPVYGTTTPVTTQTVTLSAGGGVPNSATTAALSAGSYAYIGVYSGDGNYTGRVGAVEPLTIGMPANVVVTKTADSASISAGQTAGYTLTITNSGGAAALGVTLNDPLPAGLYGDIKWTIDATEGNPSSFQITGAVGSQVLSLSPSSINLAAGASLSVHYTGVTTANDTGGTSTNPALNVGGLANYAVLYEGTGNNQLSISNDTINGNIGIGGGQVQFNGPGTIHGELDFSAANSNQYHNTNGSNVGPTSVNYNVSAVTTAIAAANSLSSSLGGLTGTNISFNNSNQVVNESSGALYTNVNGVNYRVFNVTSYSENNNDTVTIVGDGSGDPVVFNFAYNSNTNLGGQVMLTGGLTDDQVMWNFTSSNRQVQLNDNGGTYLGVILAPHDQYQSNSSNLYGRVYGGVAGNMQIVSGANVYTPAGLLSNTATVSATNESSIPSATATITITPAVHNADLSAASGSLAYTPSQIRAAYGINNLSLDGTGQTIAIVDAYDNPDIFQTLDTFDNEFGLADSGPTLAQQYGNASSFLTVLNQDGQTSSLPAVDPTGGWEAEEALDVEWAHAVAPGAQIVLVEANSQSLSDLFSSVATAANQPGVSVVSMSWGLPEGVVVSASDEAHYDSILTTPAGHQGVTFVTSTGDYGTADPEYPAFSPNVVAVGGTSLYLNSDNSYNNETGWGDNSAADGTVFGSGGGISQYEAEPAYQLDVQGTGYRTAPDVSFLADPNTGVWMADTYNASGGNPWLIAGGTSLAAPSWAALFALANQGRVAAGNTTLGSASDPTATDEALYSLPQSDFNSIVSGTNGGFNASAGYNMVTGLGTPIADRLIPDLVAYTTPINFQANALPNQGVVGGPQANSNLSDPINVFNLLSASPGHAPTSRESLPSSTQAELTVAATNLNSSVPATLVSPASITSTFVAEVSNSGPFAALPTTSSDNRSEQPNTSYQGTLPHRGYASLYSLAATTTASVQSTPMIPNAGASTSPYRSAAAADATEWVNATPHSWRGPLDVLDAVFMSLGQDEARNDHQSAAIAEDGELGARFSMAGPWRGDVSKGVTIPSTSAGANWDEMASPAITLVLAAGYPGVTAGASQIERQRGAERSTRRRGA